MLSVRVRIYPPTELKLSQAGVIFFTGETWTELQQKITEVYELLYPGSPPAYVFTHVAPAQTTTIRN